jgi:ribosomal protein L11 methyltransferase
MTAKLLILKLNPKDREQALAWVIKNGINTLEEKLVGRELQLHLQIPPNTHPQSLAKKLSHPIFKGVFTKILKDESWKKAYQKYLTPFPFPAFPSPIPPLVIDPRGSYPKKPKLNTLIIHGELSFGTGQHPSTQLAGYLLQKALRENSISALLDVGCGTGILAMVAYRRGLRDIVAVENDPEARRVARNNFRGNKIRGVQIKDCLSEVRRRFPLIVANILATTLIDLKDEIASRLKKGGRLILSGRNYRDVPTVLQAYQGFRLRERKNQKGWTALWFERK